MMKSLARTVVYGGLEAVTAGRGVRRTVGGAAIRFPARWSRYYPADYEPETFRFLREQLRPGAAVMDIGAHLGLFTVFMAKRVGPTGRVFSFEPTPRTRQVLERTVRLNECEAVVQVRPEAVAAQTGTAVFYDAAEAVSNASSLVAHPRGDTPIHVPTITLDDLVDRHGIAVECLKIDVEGAELGVLRGGRRTLDATRPALALALHPQAIRRAGGSLAEIWALLSDVGYRVWHDGRVASRDWFCDQRQLVDVHVLFGGRT